MRRPRLDEGVFVGSRLVPSASAAIEVAGLTKHYGAVRALDGVSLTVEAGEVFGLLGPNGAGKTTTVEILEGYRRLDAGEVRVLDLDPWRDGARLRPRIGVMLQDGGLYPGIRPLEALALFASYYDDPDDPERLLDVVGLREAEHTLVRRMSGGQYQRLSLALALIGRPSLVFLDEPTAGLDPRARATTWDLVRELRDHGATVVLTTHAMDEAEQLCNRLAIIDHGRMVGYGTPAELTATAAADETRFSALPELDRAGLAAALGLDAGARAGAPPGRLRRRRARDPGADRNPRRLAARPRRDLGRAARRARLPGRGVPPLDERGSTVKPRALAAQTRIELLLTLRRSESLLVTLAIPLGILVFFSKVDAVTDLADPVDFLVPGVLALAVMSTAMVSLGIATGYERRYGVLKRLGSTPLSRGGLLTAKTANVLLIELVQAAVIVVVGIALGWSTSERILPAVLLLLVGTVAFAGIGLLMAGTLRAEANLALANALFLLLLFLGGMAYPLTRLPTALQDFAEALPAAALAEAVRDVLSPAHAFPLGHVLVLLTWAIAAPVAAALLFRWEE